MHTRDELAPVPLFTECTITLRVQELLKGFRLLKSCNLARRNFDLRTCLRVVTHACGTLLDLERTELRDANLVAIEQNVCHSIEHCLNNVIQCTLAELALILVGNVVDEPRLCPV